MTIFLVLMMIVGVPPEHGYVITSKTPTISIEDCLQQALVINIDTSNPLIAVCEPNLTGDEVES
jgi:hypothetical protein